jgi:hypothetical protein
MRDYKGYTIYKSTDGVWIILKEGNLVNFRPTLREAKELVDILA